MQFLTSALLLAVLAWTVVAVPVIEAPDIGTSHVTDPSLSPSEYRSIAYDASDEHIYAMLQGSKPNSDVGEQTEANSTLQARSDSYKIECGGYWRNRESRFKDGIKYLRRVRGEPKLGPHDCDRVSCSWKSGIHWCNDNGGSVELVSFSVIADDAEKIVNECASFWGEVSGTLYHSNNWRVVVKKTGQSEDDPDC